MTLTYEPCPGCGFYVQEVAHHVCSGTFQTLVTAPEKIDPPAKDTKASEIQVGGSHYQEMPIQPNAYIHANGLNWFAGNIVKYASRAGRKGGKEGMIVDIQKAKHYAELWLERINEGEVK